jgi:hypothetical protein
MDIQEIISKLEYYDGTFPENAIIEALKRREDVIPELLKILKETIQNTDRILYDPNFRGHIFSVFLLAQFREKQAYPLIIELFSLPEPDDIIIWDFFSGDVTTDNICSILASVSCGDITLIQKLIENEAVDEFVRCSALSSLLVLYMEGELSRDVIITYFKNLFSEKLERKPSIVWDNLIECCLDLFVDELYDDIMSAYQLKLVQEQYISIADVKKAFTLEKQETINNLHKVEKYKLIKDTVKELCWWDCFYGSPQNVDEIAQTLLDKVHQSSLPEEAEQSEKPQGE